MAHTSIQKLREGMTPESRRRATLKAREMMAEMLISEIRREAGFTQEQVAELLGIRQPSLYWGRTASYPTAPPQTPACGITAQGSSRLLT